VWFCGFHPIPTRAICTAAMGDVVLRFYPKTDASNLQSRDGRFGSVVFPQNRHTQFAWAV
jgi:hypothetical protein